MSTAELEAEYAETGDAETLEEIEATLPGTTDDRGVKGEDDAAPIGEPDEDDIIRAEGEGLPPVDDAGHEGEDVAVVAASEAQPEPEKPKEPVTSGIEWELSNIIEVNRQVLSQRGVVEEKADDLKREKKELERLQDQLNALISRIAANKRAAEPDPEKYPLLDKPREATEDDKARVDGMFPRPEAIPAVPANLEAFQRMRSEEATLEGLKLGKRALAKLEGQGITRASHLYGKDPRSLGLTEKQADEVESIMAEFWDACASEWARQHPDGAGAGAVTGTAAGDDGDHPEGGLFHDEAEMRADVEAEQASE